MYRGYFNERKGLNKILILYIEIFEHRMYTLECECENNILVTKMDTTTFVCSRNK